MSSDALEGLIGDHLLRTASWAKPAAIYVALFTTLPADDGTGGVEVSGGNYARVQHGPGDAYWAVPVAGSGQFSNIGAVSYVAPNAPWGTVVGFGLYDAVTGGMYLGGAALASSRVIAAGDPVPNFPEGALKVVVS